MNELVDWIDAGLLFALAILLFLIERELRIFRKERDDDKKNKK